jgi:hypothetical protein
MPRRHSNSTLVFTGFVLCLVAAIIAILFGVLALVDALPSLHLQSLIRGVLFFALGLLSLVISMRIRRHYDAVLAVLLLVFAILFLAFGLGIGVGLGTEALLVGILLLLGTIILMIGKGA